MVKNGQNGQKWSKMVDFALKMSFLGKNRQNKPPVIQKSIAMKLFNPMMKGWLKTEQFCQKCLRSQPASIIEAFNSSCYNSMNVIKARFQKQKSKKWGVFEFSNFLRGVFECADSESELRS